jgi:ribonuclease T2
VAPRPCLALLGSILFSFIYIDCKMKAATTVAVASAAVASASLYNQSKENHTCVLVPDYQSCSPEANPLTVDSCCVETFGGLLLSTQFWDVYTGFESEGQLLPEKNWTIHGLWPDFW